METRGAVRSTDGLADDLAEVLSKTVADVVAAPLLLSASGDQARARAAWGALRDEIDRRVAARLDLGSSLQGTPLLEALGISLATGIGDAAAMVERALADARDPVEVADARRAAAKLGTWCGDTLRTAALTTTAARQIAGIDDGRAVELWLDAATTLGYSGHLHAGLDAARSGRAVPDAPPRLAKAAAVIEGFASALLGEDPVLPDPTDELLGALGDGDVRLGVMLAGLLVWTGRHEVARQLLGRVEATATASAPDTLPYVLDVVADLELRAGWWRSAAEVLGDAEARARHSGARNVRALVLVRGARLDAMRGDDPACLARLAQAEQIADVARLPIVELHAESTRALLAVGSGEHEAAVVAGRRAEELAAEMGLALTGVDLFAADLLEALVRTGRPDEAAAILERLDADATRPGHLLDGVVATRGHLLTCCDDDVEVHAARHHARRAEVHLPFEDARTNLVLGERRRRMGARRDARILLNEAHRTFARLGATPWAARSLAELRAAGSRLPGDDDADRLGLLTPQEGRVARQVADGATNQEAAAAMYLSLKSIERHLTSIYRKLSIRSRTELARCIDRVEGRAPGTGEGA